MLFCYMVVEGNTYDIVYDFLFMFQTRVSNLEIFSQGEIISRLLGHNVCQILA